MAALLAFVASRGHAKAHTGVQWLWVAGLDGALTRINAFTKQSEQTLQFRHPHKGIACYHGRVWVALDGANP